MARSCAILRWTRRATDSGYAEHSTGPLPRPVLEKRDNASLVQKQPADKVVAHTPDRGQRRGRGLGAAGLISHIRLEQNVLEPLLGLHVIDGPEQAVVPPLTRAVNCRAGNVMFFPPPSCRDQTANRISFGPSRSPPAK